MKRTFEQGVNAQKAGLQLEEVEVELLADMENHRDWIMGWLWAHGQMLEKKYLGYDLILAKYEESLGEWKKHIGELQEREVKLRQQLKDVLCQTVH